MIKGATSDVATVDISAINRELPRLAAATGKDLAEILPQEMRLLGDDLVTMTPPFKRFGSKGGAKGAGDDTVKRGIGRVLSTADKLRLNVAGDENRVAKRVHHLIRTKNREALSKVLPNLGFVNMDDAARIFPDDAVSVADRARGHDGTVPKGSKRYLVTRPQKAKARRAALLKVGKMKSGWLGAVHFGLKLPGWIMRHAGLGFGRFQDNSKDPKNPFVSITNHHPGFHEKDASLGIVRKGFRNRAIKLHKRVESAIRHRAKETTARMNR